MDKCTVRHHLTKVMLKTALNTIDLMVCPMRLLSAPRPFKRSLDDDPRLVQLNPLPDDKILDRSKLKQIADDISKCI